jgi:release factor glutamine methyltransferase
MTTLRALHVRLADALLAAQVPEPRRAARALVALALELPNDAVLRWPDRLVSDVEQARAEALLARRLAGEPLSRIRGEREFWSLPFRLSPATLDPRPDSETLIAAALRLFPDRQARLRILDLGTGSGCLLLSLLTEYQQAWGVGIDLAPLAAATAAANAQALGLTDRAAFLGADWTTALRTENTARFDLVVSNPPYIPAEDIAELSPEVRVYDPRLALDGGSDGLAAYQRMIPEFKRLLRPGGWGLLEIGAGQADAVADMCMKCGVLVTDVISDLAAHPRIVIVKNDAAV